MIRALILDIGGVVTHTDFDALYRNFAEKAGIEPERVSAYHGAHMDEMLLGETGFSRFLQELAVPGKTDEDLKWIWIEEMQKVRSVNEDLLGMVDVLRDSMTTAVLTNLTEGRYLADVEAGIYDHFDHVVLSHVEGMKKPDPRFFRLALDRAGVAAEEAVFVDDQLGLVTAATMLGMHGIVFAENGRLREDLNALGVAI